MDEINFLEGLRFARDGDYQKAAESFAKFVKAAPSNPEGWLFLGHCLNNIDQRKYCYERVLSLSPGNESAKAGLANLTQPLKNLTPSFDSSPSVKEKKESEPLHDLTSQKEPVPAEKNGRRKDLMQFVAGLILTLLVCVLPSVIFINFGKIDTLLIQYVYAQYLQQPSTIAAVNTPQNIDEVLLYMTQAQALMSQGDYAGALQYLDQVLAVSTDNYTAYGMRALCYYRLASPQNSFEAFQSYLINALSDIDMAIALTPGDADLYAFRRNILSDYLTELPYQTDRAYLLNAAIENEDKFLELSTSKERNLEVSVLKASDLVYAGRCEEAMQLVRELETKIFAGDGNRYGCLLCAHAAASACLGDMDVAVEDMNEMMSKNGNNSKWDVYYKALYLYQGGKTEEALQVLNNSIDLDPTFSGRRYFIRAMIKLDMGDREGAANDVQLGKMYSWEQAGLYAHVNGRLALADENEEEAIYWLQLAYASLNPTQRVLQDRVLDELTKLGAEPWDEMLTLSIQVTPIPSVVP